MTLIAATGWWPVAFAGRNLKWFWGKNKSLTVTAVLLIGAFKIRAYIKKRKQRERWNKAGKDVVVVHAFPRGRYCPNLSPFVMKLETYLRMAKIPYQVDFEEPMGPKGKCPWITLNGQDTGDSQLVMEMLGVKFNKNFSAHLTAEEKAVSQAMRVMVDEHFFWCVVCWRFGDVNPSFFKAIGFPVPMHIYPIRKMVVNAVKKWTYVQGIGRHRHHEVLDIARKDLAALSVYLGKKNYLMGDQPTEVDCTVFGMLSQVVWNSPDSPYLRMLENDFINLYAYCQRMKNKFWPDWNQHLNPPVSDTL